VLVLAVVAGLGLLARSATTPLGPSAPFERDGVWVGVATPASPTAAVPVAAGGDSGRADLVARDPFRLAHRPAAVAYDPLAPVAAAGPAPVPRPALLVVGIVWDGGPSPTALLEGVPGAAGARVVRSGDIVAGFRVIAIRPDRVVLAGLDTVWALTVREPWR
jgi:hypothetical protein